MSFGGFLIWLLVAGVCGAIAQRIVGYTHGGCLVCVVLGFIRRIVWELVGRADRSPGTIHASDQRQRLSGFVVYYRHRFICSGFEPSHSAATTANVDLRRCII